MKYFYDYNDFVNEGNLFNGDSSVNFSYMVNADEHYYLRLDREDNEPDIEGSQQISPSEVESDIKKAIPRMAKLNLFNKGIYWISNKLNSEILIQNSTTFLNIIIIVEKENINGISTYIFTVKTVMRKKAFVASGKEKTLTISIK